jgi:hypothetical protein
MNDKEFENHDAHVRTRWMIERLRALQRVNLEFTPQRPDDEVKMAVHSAHDAGDPAYIAEVNEDVRRVGKGKPDGWRLDQARCLRLFANG